MKSVGPLSPEQRQQIGHRRPTHIRHAAPHCGYRRPIGRGSSGNCTAEFVVTAADGATRAMAVARLVNHLPRLGWLLLLDHSTFARCRETGGILPWTRTVCGCTSTPIPCRPDRRPIPRQPSPTSTTLGRDRQPRGSHSTAAASHESRLGDAARVPLWTRTGM